MTNRLPLSIVGGILLFLFVPNAIAPRHLTAQSSGALVTFTPIQYPASADISAAIDFNDDGRPDLINVYDNCPTEISSRANTGGRTFAGGPLFEELSCGPYSVGSVAVADVDADGHQDFLYLDHNHNTIGVIAADGMGGLVDPVFTPLGEQSADFAVADLDGDGLTDLVVTEAEANAVVVYAGDGTRRFNFLAFARGGGEPGQVAVGDVDGDGDLDVATVNRTTQTMTILLGDGRGRLTRLGDTAVGGVPAGLTVGDLNRDGRSDVIVAREDPTISLFVAAGGGAFAARSDFVSSRLPDAYTRRAPIVADLNGDGFPDVAAGFHYAGLAASFSILYGNGLGSLSEPESFAGQAPVDVADFDGDGRLDVVAEQMVVNWSGVVAANRPPQANAGNDLSVPESEQSQVSLDAFLSADPDGHAVAYDWRDADGTPFGPNRRFTPFATPRPPGTYRFVVTVDDLHGGRSTDEIAVTVQPEETGGSNPSGPVAWTATVNVTASGATLTKSGGCDGCPDAGAVSGQEISNGGWFEFVPTLGGRMYAGLSQDGWTSTSPGSIGHALSFWPDGGWDIREFGQYRAEGRFVQGDLFRIAIEDRQVRYYKNNTLLYQSAFSPSLPARLDASFLSTGSQIGGAVVRTVTP